ncbi:MAG: hypothetical protein MUF49_27270, partial [Oculatellaceae cyanobacterium Prado106]|nr:hypothetical protein [Oculatellaceae cyanobacterium Prado106]
MSEILQRSFTDDPGLSDRLFDLLEIVFPEIGFRNDDDVLHQLSSHAEPKDTSGQHLENSEDTSSRNDSGEGEEHCFDEESLKDDVIWHHCESNIGEVDDLSPSTTEFDLQVSSMYGEYEDTEEHHQRDHEVEQQTMKSLHLSPTYARIYDTPLDGRNYEDEEDTLIDIPLFDNSGETKFDGKKIAKKVNWERELVGDDTCKFQNQQTTKEVLLRGRCEETRNNGDPEYGKFQSKHG